MTFFDEVREGFEFLVSEFGFAGPRVRAGRTFLALDYTGPRIGVAVEFDVREEKVDVVLVRLADGTWPPRYASGWLYLDRIANARGVPLETGVFRLPQSAAEIIARIAEEATLLRSVADVLRGDGSQLDQFKIASEAATEVEPM